MAKKVTFMDRARAVFTGIKAGVSHPADLLGMVELLLRSHESNSGAQVNPVTAMRVAAVYACVTVISETLAVLPLRVYRKLANNAREEAVEHPLNRLFRTPNPWQNRMEFIEMLAIHLCLRGNAYALMIKTYNTSTGNNDRIEELIPLHPDYVRVSIRPDKLPQYWYRDPRGNGQEMPIAWEDMVHIRYKSYNGYTGLSPIQAQADTIGLGITLQDHTGSVFKHGAHIGGALEHPETLTDDVAKRIRESWQETYGGSLNSGKVLVLEEGMKFNRTGMTMQDAQYIDTKKLNRVEIASIYRVPPYKIGAYDKISYNSMEQAALEFVTDCVMAWATRFELAFDRDLVRADQTYYTKFDMRALLRGDIKTRFEAYKMGREGGFLSANDVRGFEEMNPVTGPGGDEYIRPLNFVPLGSPPPDPNAKPPADPNAKQYLDALLAIASRPNEVHVPVDARSTVNARTTLEAGAVQASTTIAEGAVQSKTDVRAGDTSLTLHQPGKESTRTTFVHDGDKIVGSETHPIKE